MKRLLFRYFPLALLIVVFAGIVVHAPLTVYAGTLFPSLAVPLKAWKEVLIVIAAMLLAIRLYQIGEWRKFLSDRLLWIIGAYWLLHVVALLWTEASTQSIVAGLLIDLRYTLFAVSIYAFITLYPEYRRLFVKVAVVGACVVVGFAMLQLVLPKDILSHIGYSHETIEPYLTVDKNPDYVRINSTMRGPNSLGAYAVIAIAGVVAYGMYYSRSITLKTHKLLNLFLAVGAFIALWVSYSRSAVIAAAVAVGIVALRKQWSKISAKVGATLVGLVVVLSLGMYVIRDTAFVHNVILHDDPTTGAMTTSNDAHASSLLAGLTRMFHEPFGGGIGSTGSASLLGDEPSIVENQYLMIAHEVGWLGLALFGVIFTMLLVRIWRLNGWLAQAVFASGIGLALIGLLLPVWADDTVSLVWWGLAGLVIAKGESHERTTNKKAKRTT